MIDEKKLNASLTTRFPNPKVDAKGIPIQADFLDTGFTTLTPEQKTNLAKLLGVSEGTLDFIPKLNRDFLKFCECLKSRFGTVDAWNALLAKLVSVEPVIAPSEQGFKEFQIEKTKGSVGVDVVKLDSEEENWFFGNFIDKRIVSTMCKNPSEILALCNSLKSATSCAATILYQLKPVGDAKTPTFTCTGSTCPASDKLPKCTPWEPLPTKFSSYEYSCGCDQNSTARNWYVFSYIKEDCGNSFNFQTNKLDGGKEEAVKRLNCRGLKIGVNNVNKVRKCWGTILSDECVKKLDASFIDAGITAKINSIPITVNNDVILPYCDKTITVTEGTKLAFNYQTCYANILIQFFSNTMTLNTNAFDNPIDDECTTSCPTPATPGPVRFRSLTTSQSTIVFDDDAVKTVAPDLPNTSVSSSSLTISGTTATTAVIYLKK